MLELTAQEREAVEKGILIMMGAGMREVVEGLESLLLRSNPEPTVDAAPYAIRKPDNVVMYSRIMPLDHASVVIKWGVQNVGFGEFSIHPAEDGKSYKIWNECMGPEFIKHVLNHLVDTATFMEP